MWPWGHVAVGYLLYAGALDRRFTRSPGTLATVVLVVATQVPDLVDKPLAWNLGVIPNGRSLAHSLLVATVVIALVWWVASRRGRGDLGVAFGVGYASHLAADAFYPFVAGEWGELAFLGWPLLPAVEYDGSPSVLSYFSELARELAAGEVAAAFAFELGLVVLAAVLWVSHGTPGVGAFGLSESRR